MNAVPANRLFSIRSVTRSAAGSLAGMVTILAMLGWVPAAFGATASLPTNASITGLQTTAMIDLSLSNAGGAEAADLDITYTSSVVSINGDAVVGPLAAGCEVTTNAGTPGLVRIGVACVDPLMGSGTGIFLRIPFRSESVGTANLVISRCSINEDAIACPTPVNGQLSVVLPTATATRTRTPTSTNPPPAATATNTRTRTATNSPPVGTATRTRTRTATSPPPPATNTRTRTPTLPPPTVTLTPSRTATSILAGLGATAVSINVPTSMTAGQQYPVSVTMRNTGTATWTEGGLYRLGAVNPQDNSIWGSGRVLLNSGESIGPGQQKTFNWTAQAPAAPGTYNFQWRMVRDGVAWFGDSTANAVVTVSAPTGPPNAAFVTHSIPLAMIVGQQYTASVTMQNTGGTTWTPGTLYRLGAISPENNSIWGSGRVFLAAGESIAPGQQKKFTWTVTAPPGAGLWNFQWRMLQEGVTWFGAPSENTVVTVANGGPPNAAYLSQTVPTTMTAGQQYSVSVRVQNTGGTAWSAAGLYRLGAINPYDNVTWGMGRIVLSNTEAVGPGQQKTFTFTVRAPTTPGTYNFQWRMVQEGVTWFGDTSANVAVNVTP